MLKPKKRQVGEFNASSMADITFLLLIFFLVTTSISSDKGVWFLLPEKNENQDEQKVKGVVNIILNDENKVLLGTKNQEEEVDIFGIKNQLILLSKEKDIPIDTMIVSLKATSGSTYENYIEVLDQVKSAKIKVISLAQE